MISSSERPFTVNRSWAPVDSLLMKPGMTRGVAAQFISTQGTVVACSTGSKGSSASICKPDMSLTSY